MADQKISDLPEVTSLADNDWLTGVDVSNTTNSPTGENVKIQKSNLVPSVAAGTVVTEEIDRITDPVSGEFDIAITTGYDRVILYGSIRSTAATTADGVKVYLNEDTTDANYMWQAGYSENGNPVNTETLDDTRLHLCPGSSSPVGSHLEFNGVLQNPDGTNVKVFKNDGWYYREASRIVSGDMTTAWEASTAAVIRIRLRTDNHPTDTLTGTVIVYGERTA